MHSDDTPADDRLLDDIRNRLAVATEADPVFGTVELSVGELARLLELHDMHDASLIAWEYTQGCMAQVIRQRNATLEAVTLALLADEPGLADTISDILRARR